MLCFFSFEPKSFFTVNSSNKSVVLKNYWLRIAKAREIVLAFTSSALISIKEQPIVKLEVAIEP